MEYQGHFHLDQPPAQVWAAISDVEAYQGWWGWLSEVSCEGSGLRRGTILRGVVAPPVPYRMRIAVTLGQCRRPHRITAMVSGDLVGPASLRLRQEGTGSAADVEWSVEMTQWPMRMACAVAFPMLRWGHDRVVEQAVRGFVREMSRRSGQPSGGQGGGQDHHGP